MRPTPAPLRTRTGLAAGVLGLHALVVLLALRLGAWADREPAPPATQPLLWLRLPVTPREGDRTPATTDAVRPAQRAVRAATDRTVREPAAITWPTPEEPRDEAATSLARPEAAASAASAPVALNLTLPGGASAPWRRRNPALEEPWAAAAGVTLEARIATALGGRDRITQERLDDGRIRFRRGNQCLVVHPNRAERIDPFNASVSPRARPVEGC